MKDTSENSRKWTSEENSTGSQALLGIWSYRSFVSLGRKPNQLCVTSPSSTWECHSESSHLSALSVCGVLISVQTSLVSALVWFQVAILPVPTAQTRCTWDTYGNPKVTALLSVSVCQSLFTSRRRAAQHTLGPASVWFPCDGFSPGRRRKNSPR